VWKCGFSGVRSDLFVRRGMIFKDELSWNLDVDFVCVRMFSSGEMVSFAGTLWIVGVSVHLVLDLFAEACSVCRLLMDSLSFWICARHIVLLWPSASCF